MSDDLFKDCDCGDCNCDFDCDCGDCDCSCDDCLPGNNLIIICCCIPPASNTSDHNKTNRADTGPDCFPCCCCCDPRSPRRPRRQGRKKKKGFCCWRLWCCFGRNEPSPPPSPPRPGPDELSPRGYYRRDGRYPPMAMEDPDFYMNMNDRRARHHELDMPPRRYKPGGRYPMREEMCMYRDEYYGRAGAKWDDPRKEYRSSGGYGMTSREDQRNKSGMVLEDAPYMNMNDRGAKREDMGKAREENTRRDVPPKDYHGRPDHRQDKPVELVIRPEDYGKDDKHSHQEELDVVAPRPSTSKSKDLDMLQGDHPTHIRRGDDGTDYDTAHQGHQFEGKWSRPVKYEEPRRQTNN